MNIFGIVAVVLVVLWVFVMISMLLSAVFMPILRIGFIVLFVSVVVWAVRKLVWGHGDDYRN